jgi:hypothetical protein
MLICRAFARMGGPAPFSDAICLTQAEWDVLSANELIDMQEVRFQNWLTSLNNPIDETAEEEITEEE